MATHACARQLDLFNSHTPSHLYCGFDKMAQKIRIKRIALRYPYISVNPPKLKLWLPFDIDAEQGGLAWERAGLAMPNVSIVNPENGHAHLLYGLEAPVATSDAARLAPLRYLDAVERAYLAKMEPYGADSGFAGLMVKNPMHSHWKAFWGRLSFWSLGELEEYVDLKKFTAKRATLKQIKGVGVGRNVALFNFLGPEGKWSYSAVWRYRGERYEVWYDAVLNKALEMNGEFSVPLQYSEIKSIARSVAKWVWQRDKVMHQKFLDRQSWKGQKGGKASGEARLFASEERRATASLMHARGMSTREIANELDVNQSTVSRWVRVMHEAQIR